MQKLHVCIITVLALSQRAFAAEPPSAGGQMQQIPPVPGIQKTVPKMQIQQDREPPSTASDSVRIQVNALRITGQTLYSEATLLALTGFTPGSRLSLSDLRVMTIKISDHYHKQGYFVTQAYLPQQEIKDGVVTINVLEGRYGKILLHNRTNVSDSLEYSLLSGLDTGTVISSAPLERRLLLLSDLPGVEVASTLVPGVSLGTSDLIVDVTPGSRITGEVDADNAGNRYTGMYRIGATVNYNEPLGYGDVVSLRALTSGAGLYYLRASYQMQLGNARAGVAYSILGYELGKEFASLNANGTARVASVYGSYPLIRSRNSNLYAGLDFDYKTFQDRVDSTSTVTDKQAQVLRSSLYGDHRDNLGGGSANSYSLVLTSGNLDIQTSAARSYDASTAKTNGLYGKLGFNASRLQRVTESFSLYGSINGQLAFNNLDISEKMELGGMYAVRAYPEGEAYADEGYVLSLEARYQLPKLSERLPGQMQLIGLVDTGTVTVNKNPWKAEQNSRTLSGAGVGFTWMDPNNFALRTYYAFKLGNEPATSGPDASGQFWIQLVKYFGYADRADPKRIEEKKAEPVPVTTEPAASIPAAVIAPETTSQLQPSATPVGVSAKAETARSEKASTPAEVVILGGKVTSETEKPVKLPVDTTSSDPGWSVLVGSYLVDDALSSDMKRMRQAGLAPVIQPGEQQKSTMIRLFLSESTKRSDAMSALEKLKRHTSHAFVLKQGGKYMVYAGSYLLNAHAVAEQERLKSAGFKLALKRVERTMPSHYLALGPFRDEKSLADTLDVLKSIGVKSARTSSSGLHVKNTGATP